MSARRAQRHVRDAGRRPRHGTYTRLAALWHYPSGPAVQEEAARLFRWLVDQERQAGASLEDILHRLPAGLVEAIRLEMGALLATEEGREKAPPTGPAES